MEFLLKYIYGAAVAVWLGSVVFFSFVVAPALFRTFPSAEAGRAVGAIFPTYYLVGSICGATALGCASVLWFARGGAIWWTSAALVAPMLAATLYAGAVIEPRAASLRRAIHAAEVEPGDALRQEFGELHRRAVQLNTAVIVLGAAVLGVAAVRP